MKSCTDAELDKSFRVLSMNTRLNKGMVLNKRELADEFSVSEKTIQRDIEEIKTYQYEKENRSIVRFDAHRHGYVLEKQPEHQLTNQEVMALSKILIESRAFNKEEFAQLFNKLLSQASEEDEKQIRSLLLNECYHYTPMKHGQPLLELIWTISNYIKSCAVLRIAYRRQDGASKTHELKPVGLIFSDFYFYLIAYIKDLDKPFPAIFRLDKIESLKPTGESFSIPYNDRFEEGAFKNRIQFMYAGELTKIRFRFWGSSLEAVLDRLPTARVVRQDENGAIVESEVFGTGIKMWLLSQMEYLEVLSPKSFRDDIAETVQKMWCLYCPPKGAD